MIFSALFAHYTHLIAPVDIFVVGEYVNTTRRDGSQPPTPVTGVKGDPPHAAGGRIHASGVGAGAENGNKSTPLGSSIYKYIYMYMYTIM